MQTQYFMQQFKKSVFTVRKVCWWLVLNKARFPWNVSAISTQWLYKHPAFYGIKYINKCTISKYGKSGIKSFTFSVPICTKLRLVWQFLYGIRILNFTKIRDSLGADTKSK